MGPVHAATVLLPAPAVSGEACEGRGGTASGCYVQLLSLLLLVYCSVYDVLLPSSALSGEGSEG
jgi:hypothetical protein